jgi:hypothetical protein
MVRDLNFVCVRAQDYSMRWLGAGLWPDKYALRPLAETGSFSDQSNFTSVAAMARISRTATAVVITQTSVAYVCPQSRRFLL